MIVRLTEKFRGKDVRLGTVALAIQRQFHRDPDVEAGFAGAERTYALLHGGQMRATLDAIQGDITTVGVVVELTTWDEAKPSRADLEADGWTVTDLESSDS